MSTNSISCKTCLRKDFVAANGLRQVILRVTINRKYKQYQTHVRCKEEDWDPINRRVKRKHPNAKDLNKLIENAEKRYVEISTYFYLQQMPPSHEVFDAMYYQKIAHTLVHTVFHKILEYKTKTKQIERATQVAHGCFIRRLHKYAPQLQFYEIDAKFLAEWDDSLIAEGLGQNQRHKLLKTFKAYCNYAKQHPWNIKFLAWPFDEYKVPEIEGRRQYLKEEELKSLIRLYDSEPEMSYFERQVLRVFLFMCFTGIRFSDAMAIEESNLYGNSLRFIPQKTKKRGKHLYIPLNDHAKKYLWEHPRKRFPKISNPVMNRVLKRIDEIAGINKRLSTHMARHTFTTLLLRNGVPIQDVKELRGDAKLNTTMTYFHTESEYLRNQISVLDYL